MTEKSFFCVGINYKTADESVRGLFALNTNRKVALLNEAKTLGIKDLLVISTCNRTELYGQFSSSQIFKTLLCKHSNGSIKTLEKHGYTLEKKQAMVHLFKVGAGLESQILGDFEIIGQLKQSFKISKKMELVSHFLERLCNSVVQASKRIKHETGLSTGATSVAFATVQYILGNVENVSQKHILLFGIGKIGKNTCENLVKHTQNKHITLINRTKGKADPVGGKFSVQVKDYANLKEELTVTDVLIVATGANKPTICADMLPKDRKMLILDLALPKNVDDSVSQLPNISLLHIDGLSEITAQALEDRKAEVPRAIEILNEISEEFFDWLETRQFAPVISALKNKLLTIKEEEILFQKKKNPDFSAEQVGLVSDRIVHKITSKFVTYIKKNNSSYQESIKLIEGVFDI